MSKSKRLLRLARAAYLLSRLQGARRSAALLALEHLARSVDAEAGPVAWIDGRFFVDAFTPRIIGAGAG